MPVQSIPVKTSVFAASGGSLATFYNFIYSFTWADWETIFTIYLPPLIGIIGLIIAYYRIKNERRKLQIDMLKIKHEKDKLQFEIEKFKNSNNS